HKLALVVPELDPLPLFAAVPLGDRVCVLARGAPLVTFPLALLQLLCDRADGAAETWRVVKCRRVAAVLVRLARSRGMECPEDCGVELLAPMVQGPDNPTRDGVIIAGTFADFDGVEKAVEPQK